MGFLSPFVRGRTCMWALPRVWRREADTTSCVADYLTRSVRRASGFVLAVWSDNTDIYYSYSTTLGTGWSPAIKVTQGTTQAGKSNVFPWVAADANGHVAIAW